MEPISLIPCLILGVNTSIKYPENVVVTEAFRMSLGILISNNEVGGAINEWLSRFRLV